MKLEQQVTNLELSKKLKELGVKQESLFYWSEDSFITEIVPQERVNPHAEIRKYYCAFLASELGEILPYKIEGKKENQFLCIYKADENMLRNDCWSICYSDKNDVDFVYFFAMTMTDCMAKMLIYLLENKLIVL